MADEEKEVEEPKAEEVQAGEEKAPKKKKKIIVAGIIIILVLLAELATAFFVVKWIKGDDPTQAAMENLKEEEQKKKMMLTKIGAVLEEPISVTVNIAGSDGDHYLKALIQLEWDEQNFPELRMKLTERKVKIQHIVIDILSTQALNDLLKSSGKQRIREAISSEINKILPAESGQISNVFFIEFIVQ